MTLNIVVLIFIACTGSLSGVNALSQVKCGGVLGSQSARCVVSGLSFISAENPPTKSCSTSENQLIGFGAGYGWNCNTTACLGVGAEAADLSCSYDVTTGICCPSNTLARINGASCSANSDCSTGYCVSGTCCASSCATSCASGICCASASCTSGLCGRDSACLTTSGGYCDANSACVSGVCGGNKCCSSACPTQCDVSGACLRSPAYSCTLNAQCVSNMCSSSNFCCDTSTSPPTCPTPQFQVSTIYPGVKMFDRQQFAIGVSIGLHDYYPAQDMMFLSTDSSTNSIVFKSHKTIMRMNSSSGSASYLVRPQKIHQYGSAEDTKYYSLRLSGGTDNDPSGLTVDSAGFVYFTLMYFSAIFRVSPSGTFRTFAGNPDTTSMYGNRGTYNHDFLDGNSSVARFAHPSSITFDKSGLLYVLDYTDLDNGCLRTVATSGVVTTLSCRTFSGTDMSYRANSLIAVSDGKLYSYFRSPPIDRLYLVELTSGNYVTTLLISDSDIKAFAIDAAQNIIFATSRLIRSMTSTGNNLTTLAGNLMEASYYLFPQNSADGVGTNANFSAITGLVLSQDGKESIIVADGNVFRKLTLQLQPTPTPSPSTSATTSLTPTSSATQTLSSTATPSLTGTTSSTTTPLPSCGANFFLLGNSCKACPGTSTSSGGVTTTCICPASPATYYSSTLGCVPCATGVTLCTSSRVSVTCLATYYLSASSCMLCPTNTYSSAADPQSCVSGSVVQASFEISGVTSSLLAQPAALATSITAQLNNASNGQSVFSVIQINAAGKQIYPVLSRLLVGTAVSQRLLETTTSISIVVAAAGTGLTSTTFLAGAQNAMTTALAIVLPGAVTTAPSILCDASKGNTCTLSTVSNDVSKDTASTTSSQPASGLGAAIGGAVGGVIFIIIVVVVIYYIYGQKKKSNIKVMTSAPTPI